MARKRGLDYEGRYKYGREQEYRRHKQENRLRNQEKLRRIAAAERAARAKANLVPKKNQEQRTADLFAKIQIHFANV